MEEVGTKSDNSFGGSAGVVQVIQKTIAELVGTYFLVFAGCCSVVLNNLEDSKGTITFPGICLVWGFSVTLLAYTLGHVSGAHFNPSVTLCLAIFHHFPLKLVPFYFVAQVLGSFLASGSLYLLFDIDEKAYFGTVPAGSDIQSLVFELLTSFLLMFVVSSFTDSKAVGSMGAMAVGLTIVVDVFIAGPVSGASMNTARSLGPAIVMGIYRGFWIYVVGPFVGTFLGATCFYIIKQTDKPLKEIGAGSKLFRSKSIPPRCAV